MEAVYMIAGKAIRINSLYQRVHDYCSDYRSDSSPDFSVDITQADIDCERRRNARTAELEGRQVTEQSSSYLEELAVYRSICEKMPEYDTFLFHGSCVSVDGEGYLFAAVSGTGKSTHTALWRELLGEKAVMVNDDKPLIKVAPDGVTVYGTPYNGKHRLGSNIAVPLKAIALLGRSDKNTICQVDAPQIYPMLLQQMYRPSDPTALSRSLRLFDEMLGRVRLYKLGCNMQIQAAQIAYNTMKGR